MSVFTINACNRCRKRKSRCDTGIPSCRPCRDSGSECEWTNPRSKATLPRQYIIRLEDDLARLEVELQSLKRGAQFSTLLANNLGDMVPSSSEAVPPSLSPAHGDLSRPAPVEPAQFLGASSGIQLARSLLESAHSDYIEFSDNRFHGTSPSTSVSFGQPPDSGHRASNPDIPIALPPLQTTLELIDSFFDRHLVQYPILIPNDFKQRVVHFHEHSRRRPMDPQDPCLTFMIYMVLSMSLSHVPRADLNQARAFSANSMARLGTIMRIKSAQSLQCLLLLLLSAMDSSTSAPIWDISGLCIRMVVDLGYHSETTICMQGRDGPTEQEIELKRRLFWVSYTLDRSLATILGRPFTLSDQIIDVRAPYASLPEDLRPHILQWLQLQQLQSQAVFRLYMAPHSAQNDPGDSQWMTQMRHDIDTWMDQARVLPSLKQWNTDRWRYWYFHFLLLLHRPSPMSRKVNLDGYSTAFFSAKNMIQVAFLRNSQLPHAVDCIEFHSQVLSGIILLFLVLKSADIRAIARDDWLGYRSCLAQWRHSMTGHGDRWANMDRTQSVMARLADAVVAIVDNQATTESSQLSGSTTEASNLQHMPSSLPDGIQLLMCHDRSSQDVRNLVPQPPKNQHLSNSGRFEAKTASNHIIGGLSTTTPAIPSFGAFHDMAETGADSLPRLDQGTDAFQDSSDLSMMLNDDIWSGLNFADGNLSILDFLQYPLAGSETLGLPLNSVDLSTVDGGLTGSMLNFRENDMGEGFP